MNGSPKTPPARYETGALITGYPRYGVSQVKHRPFSEKVGLPGLGNSEGHPVERRNDMDRQSAAQHLVIEVGVQIGQDGAPGFYAFDPAKRVLERKVTRVRPIAQAIAIPTAGAAKGRTVLRWNAAEVARIGEVAEAEAERGDIAVLLEERQDGDRSALPLDGDRRPGGQPALGQDRRVVAAGRRCEAIAELGVHRRRGVIVEMDVDAPVPLEEQRA